MANQGQEAFSDIENKINALLAEKVNPILAEHFGASEFAGYEDGVVYVKLTGACGTCPSARFTVEDVIKDEVMSAVPEVKDVALDVSVSEDLIDMAKKLLNKNA